MEEEKGWIKTYRKIEDDPVICKDNDYFRVWFYLLLNASHQEKKVMFKSEEIILHPGSLITGRKKIAEKCDISESKIDRILKLFEKSQKIEQQMSSQNRLITILKWDMYQNSEQQVNNNRTTSEHKQECKNVRMKEYIEKENIKEKETKNKYGEYQNVLLTKKEYESLQIAYSNYEELIKFLDEYIEEKGYKSKSHYLAIKRWVVKAVCENSKKERNKEELPSWFNKDLKNEEMTEEDKKELDDLLESITETIEKGKKCDGRC